VWWELAYLIPGILLAAVIWEVAVNGWSPKTMHTHERHMLSLIPMSLEASPTIRVRIVLYMVSVIVAWPVLLLTPSGEDKPPRVKHIGKHRK
jgi:hypothetical protein